MFIRLIFVSQAGYRLHSLMSSDEKSINSTDLTNNRFWKMDEIYQVLENKEPLVTTTRFPKLISHIPNCLFQYSCFSCRGI